MSTNRHFRLLQFSINTLYMACGEEEFENNTTHETMENNYVFITAFWQKKILVGKLLFDIKTTMLIYFLFSVLFALIKIKSLV